jgi:hypothetical protein
VDLLVVFLADRLRHVEKEGGFSRAWGRNDESALAAADGGDDIDDAGGVAVGGGLEGDAFVGIDRLEFVEVGEDSGVFGFQAVDFFNFHKLGAAVAGLVLAVEPLAVA